MCNPALGTELVMPAVSIVAAAVVVKFGRPVGTAMVLAHLWLLVAVTWGEIGATVLVGSSLFAAVGLDPITTNPEEETDG